MKDDERNQGKSNPTNRKQGPVSRGGNPSNAKRSPSSHSSGNSDKRSPAKSSAPVTHSSPSMKRPSSPKPTTANTTSVSKASPKPTTANTMNVSKASSKASAKNATKKQKHSFFNTKKDSSKAENQNKTMSTSAIPATDGKQVQSPTLNTTAHKSTTTPPKKPTQPTQSTQPTKPTQPSKPPKPPKVIDPEVPTIHESTSLREHSGHIEKKRRKSMLTSALFIALIVPLLMAFAGIAVLYVMDYVAAKPAYTFVTTGSVEHTIGASALIVRDEAVYNANTSGDLLAQATEGSRVAKDQSLAMVIPSGSEDILAELRRTEQQIVDIERELMYSGLGEGASSIYADTDTQILPIMNMIRSDAQSGTMANMTSYSSSIQVLMDSRDANLNRIDFNDERLTTLLSNKERLENNLSTQAAYVTSSAPGIVSYKLDGNESVLTYDYIMSMLDVECERIIDNAQSIIPNVTTVESGKPVLRIVQNEVQYFACVIQDGNINDFALETLHAIRVPSEGIVIEDCKVIRSAVSNDGVFVVFSTQNCVERLLDRRTIDIEIVQSKTTGLRVPVTALVDADYDRGYASVLVNESGYARKVTVVIEDYDREYAIISPVEGADKPSEQTIVITNPQTVSEGEKVET